jgi:flagellar biosynthesis protein FlhA
MTTHLGELIRTHAAELLTRQQVTRLLDSARRRSGSLIQETTDSLPTGKIQKVLRNLLAEGVPIRDLEAILEVMCDSAGHTTDTDELTELVRRSLGPMLTQQYCSEDGKLWCVHIEPSLVAEISEGGADSDPSGALVRSRRVSDALTDGLARLTRHGRRPVLVCAPDVRAPVRRIIAGVMPQAAVLAYDEVGSADLESVGTIGID